MRKILLYQINAISNAVFCYLEWHLSLIIGEYNSDEKEVRIEIHCRMIIFYCRNESSMINGKVKLFFSLSIFTKYIEPPLAYNKYFMISFSWFLGFLFWPYI